MAEPSRPSCEEDPDCLTPEKLGGTLYDPASASVAWARSFPGAMAVPPQIALGPAGELIAKVGIAKDARGIVLDEWLMRFDADTGELLWMQKLEPPAKFVLDTHGNILLVRSTSLQKLDSGGNLLWSKATEAENLYQGVIAADGDDHILLARAEVAPSESEEADPKGLIRLEQLDGDGNSRWSHQFGDGTIPLDQVYLTVDRDGNVLLLASEVGAPVDFGGGALMGTNVLAKYDSSGNHVFSKVIGGFKQAYYQSDTALLSDAAGNIFIRMASYGDLDIGLGPLFCVANYMAKLDPTGALLWNRCAFADDFAVLPDGGWVTAATLSRSTNVGERQCAVLDTSSEGKDGVLARYDSTGAWLTTSCAADPSSQFLGGVVPDPAGMFYMTAAFGMQLTLPDGTKVTAVDDRWTSVIAKVDLPR